MVEIPGSWYRLFYNLIALAHGNANWFHVFFRNKDIMNPTDVFSAILKQLDSGQYLVIIRLLKTCPGSHSLDGPTNAITGRFPMAGGKKAHSAAALKSVA